MRVLSMIPTKNHLFKGDFFIYFLIAAFTNALNKGWGLSGLD